MYEYLIPEEDDKYRPELICSECGEHCKVIEETFNYAGTHCTGGKPGTHRTGIYVSNCCWADCEET